LDGGESVGDDGAGPGPACEAGGPASADPLPDFLDLAVSVTRQVQISGPSQWKHLVTGVDSLDLGFYVDWRNWNGLEHALDEGKKSAERTEGVAWRPARVVDCLILPGGKQPMYAFHLQTVDFHVFIARREKHSSKYPNVYVSLLARSLWTRGVEPAVARVVAFLEALGGMVVRSQVSRCDFCADFQIPEGISFDFLREHRVSRSPEQRPYLNGERLETYYVGSGQGCVQARIYDKALEVLQAGEKLWFADIWKLTEIRDVWRVEFQLRREALKQLGIETLANLVERAGGAWAYLTDSWLSFRVNDNENVSRRTPHLWWSAVQEVGRDYGAQLAVKREYSKGGQAPSEWYVSHGGGCLLGFAAREGIEDFDSILGLFGEKLREYWTGRDFCERYQVERLKLGFDDTADAGA
jgi:hypothetical protein